MAAELASAVTASIDVGEVAERIGLRAVAVVSELHDPPDKDFEQLTVTAALSNVHAVLRGFAACELPSAAQAPELTLNWVATMAQRGISVSAIPRCYMTGLGICDAALREAAAQLDAPEKVKWHLANSASQYLYGYCEKITGDLVDHYQRERELWVRGADSVRAELVMSIVSGRPVDIRAASAALGYDLDRRHAAVAVWVDPRSQAQPPAQALKRAAATIASKLCGIELLVVPAGASMVWAWTSGPKLSGRLVDPVTIDEQLLAAIGAVGEGMDGFVQSHRQALDGRRMAGVFSHPPGSVVSHHDVALTALLTHDLSAAGRFVREELGELS